MARAGEEGGGGWRDAGEGASSAAGACARDSNGGVPMHDGWMRWMVTHAKRLAAA